MADRRTTPREGQVAFHRLPDPLDMRIQVMVNRETFDDLAHIAYNRNRKVSDLCRCVLLDFIDKEATK